MKDQSKHYEERECDSPGLPLIVRLLEALDHHGNFRRNKKTPDVSTGRGYFGLTMLLCCSYQSGPWTPQRGGSLGLF